MKIRNSYFSALRKHQAFCLSVLLTCTALFSSGQNVTVSGALSGNGSYADLGSAFSAINGASQTGASILVNILANTTEATSAVLNSGAWTSLSVTPSGARTVTGNISGPLVDLNGADHVWINGFNSSGNSLGFSNVNTGSVTTTTLRFMADATSNTVTNCSLLGASTSSLLGTVVFTLAGVSGNSNNSISNCEIGPAGSNLPANGIYSAGNSGFVNYANAILNCSIYDYMSLSQPSGGIILSNFNSLWTIDGNRLFQTSVRNFTNTSIGNYHTLMKIISGDGYTITNNVLGYSSAAATGTYAINTSTSSYVDLTFVGIDLAVGNGTTTSVQGNTISAIDIGGVPINASPAMLTGLNFTSGKINIGTISPNVFGGASGVNLIKCKSWGTGLLLPIRGNAPTGVINIQNNIIGGITMENLYSGNGSYMIAMHVFALNLVVSGNVVGNSTPDNLRAGTPGFGNGSSHAWGFFFSNTNSGAVSVTSNTFQNITCYGASEYNTANGICNQGFSGGPTYTVSGNLVRNIKLAGSVRSNNLGQQDVGAVGISQTMGSNVVISNNTITAVSIVGVSSLGCNAAGIHYGNCSNGSIYGNYISNITNGQGSTTFTSPAVVTGIHLGTGSGTVVAYNNFISLGAGNSDNTSYIGIQTDNFWSPNPVNLIYHNTINIEGVVSSGANPSFGYSRGCFGKFSPSIVVFIKNNLITNSRSGGFGAHYAIANDYGSLTTSSSGWAAGCSNNNVLNSTFTVAVGYWGANLTLGSWQTTSAGDANSFSGIPVTYVNSAANDLHLNMGTNPTNIESKGAALLPVTTDIDGETRPGPASSVNGGAIAPDIGADEIDGMLIDNNPPSITYTTITSLCSAGDRTLMAVITDLLGVPVTGTLQPRIYFKKNSGVYVSAQGVLLTGTTYSATWSFTLNAAALGGVVDNDVISYFITAQDLSPAPNIGANPSTGFVATDVNSVTSPPTITTQTYTVKLTPSVSVNSGTACSGSAFVFNPSGAASYTITGNTFTVTPAAGVSVYSLTGSSAAGCVSSNTAVASLTVFATPTISVNSPTLCGSGTVALVPAGANTYTITGNNFTPSPVSSTSYSVSGTSTAGCVSSSVAVALVVVNAIPTIAVNSPTICSGSSVAIVPTGASSYSITGNNFTVAPLTNTAYTITGSSIAGCIASNTVVAFIVVNTTPTISVNSGSVCSGNPFVISPSGAVSYSVTGNTFTVSPLSTTAYSVTGTAANGCISSTAAVSVVTVNAPAITVNSASACAGSSVAIVPSGAVSYTITGNNFTVSPTITTSYSVTGTNSFGCTSPNPAVSVITVIALPAVTVISSSPTLCIGESAMLTAGGAFTYSWSSSQTGMNITITPTDNILYTVTGTDLNGCKSTAILAQYVSLCTGVRETSSGNLPAGAQVYPNPTTGMFVLEAEINADVLVLDIFGRAISFGKTSSVKTNLSISHLPAGIYFVKVTVAGRQQIVKLIRE